MTAGVYQSPAGTRVVQAQRGPMGTPGAGSAIYRSTTVPISGQRVMKDIGGGQCGYADPSEPGDAAVVLGISAGAALADSSMTIQCLGDMVDSAWSWTPELPVYCGPQGQLTQAAPSSGWVMRVAVAVSPTQIVIGLAEPFFLAS